jgi:hypothetical protein
MPVMFLPRNLLMCTTHDSTSMWVSKKNGKQPLDFSKLLNHQNFGLVLCSVTIRFNFVLCIGCLVVWFTHGLVCLGALLGCCVTC